MKKNILETAIKAVTLQHLVKAKRIKRGDLIVSELTLDGYERRIDLVTIENNHLFGYEIKSEADSLDRLEGQISKYLEYFDKVVVVVAPKHLERTMKIVPSNVAVWEFQNKKIIVRQKGKIQPVTEKSKLISLLRIQEIIKICNQCRVDYPQKKRKALELSVRACPLKVIKEAVIVDIKKRYSLSSQLFWQEVGSSKINEVHIDLLSPYKEQKIMRVMQENRKKDFFARLLQEQASVDNNLEKISIACSTALFGETPHAIETLLAA